MTDANLLVGRGIAAIVMVFVARWVGEAASGYDYFPGSLTTAALIAAVLLVGFQFVARARRA